MHILAINGSPRTKNNTATLLGKALEGAASCGASTETVHLYTLDFKGCRSCFACKLKGGRSYGKCACQDGLSPVLEQAMRADALILGSPIYFGQVTGVMRSFMERLMFPVLTYTEGCKPLRERKIATAFIYTMGVNQKTMEEYGYPAALALGGGYLASLFGSCEALYAYDTYQFDDYSKYYAPLFDESHKAKVRAEQFPRDCQKAFELGAKLAQTGNGA